MEMNYILFLKAFQEKYHGIKDAQLLFQYLREELQYLVLQALYTKTVYPIYFMGGTLLRLSYGINRFSEDIDLALDKPNADFPAEKFHEGITRTFSEKVTGFNMTSKLNTNRNVVKIMLSFAQILFDLGISPLESQTIKIKIELDTNPPGNATLERKTYRSMAGDYMISTHDLNTTFAGKLTAVLLREYQKGRDFYDLQWYLQRSPGLSVNLAYLNANCMQQGLPGYRNKSELFKSVGEKVEHLDIALLRSDLERFIIMDEKSFEEWLTRYIPDTLALLSTHLKRTA